jgi:4-oxalocrotonate tautomerase
VPFTRVSLLQGKSSEYKQAILEGVYQALRETFAVAENDRFMVVNEFSKDNFTYHPTYLGMERSDDVVVIEITCNNTRTVEQKKSLYRDIVGRLSQKPGIRPDDVVICIVEVAKENWSMGRGLASFA